MLGSTTFLAKLIVESAETGLGTKTLRSVPFSNSCRGALPLLSVESLPTLLSECLLNDIDTDIFQVMDWAIGIARHG